MADDNKKNTTDSKPSAVTDRIQVSLIKFGDAQDLPGEQVEGVTCYAEAKGVQRGAVAWYVPLLGGFEIHTVRNGEIVGVDIVPRERVLRWRRL
jgi:hypothetical protein